MVVPVEQVDHDKRKMQETWTNVAEKRIILPLKCRSPRRPLISNWSVGAQHLYQFIAKLIFKT